MVQLNRSSLPIAPRTMPSSSVMFVIYIDMLRVQMYSILGIENVIDEQVIMLAAESMHWFEGFPFRKLNSK